MNATQVQSITTPEEDKLWKGYFHDCAMAELNLLNHCNFSSYIDDLSGENLDIISKCLSDTNVIISRVRGACEDSEYKDICIPTRLRGKCLAQWMIRNSIYYYQLLPWIHEFDKHQILFIKSEDFFENTATVMGTVTEFLGLESIKWDDFVTSAFNIVLDTTDTSNSLRIDPQKISYPEICSETRGILADYFAPFNNKLEETISINWDEFE